MLSRSRRISIFLLAAMLFAPCTVRGEEQTVDSTDTPSETTPSSEEAQIKFFEERVRPILVSHCHNCHSATTNSRGGLRVDDRNGLLVGGDRGPAVVPGDPENSLLIQAVRQTHDKVKMPPKSKLADEEVAALVQWIHDGAAWPKVVFDRSSGEPKEWYDRLRREHWSWQPLSDPSIPDVQDGTWPLDPLDRFVLKEIEARGLKPVADADPRTFIRRVTFDLTGLPPTPSEIAAFESRIAELQSRNPTNAQSSMPTRAVEELVDRLLASPGFGEKWGRHWLDIARYGESTGSGRNLPYPHAWRYRDYVIGAFNNDKPYDQFVREQIAGDLLPADTQEQRDEQMIATGFLALGVRDVNQRFKVRFIMDNIDEQIDTMSRAFLGLTVSCARCHDHKFDPIPTADYYALAGIFHSSDLCAALRNKMGGGGMDYFDSDLLLLLGPAETTQSTMAEKVAEAQTLLDEAKNALASLQQNKKEEEPTESEGGASSEDLKGQIDEARKKIRQMENQLEEQRDPARHGPVALGVRDGKQIGDTEIRIRGEAEKLGPVVPRGFLTLFDVPDAPTLNPKQSGRLELARWLASEQNPLTPRVISNRVWQHLFGRGLVPSVDNFGVTGDDPSHPALLDHLARRLIADGWSLKKLVRTIVLSHAYRLSSDHSLENEAVDPGNRYLWRHSPRRLEAEEIRDAMLMVAGRLDVAPQQGASSMNYKVREINNNGAEAKQLMERADLSLHRSIYLPLLRGLVPRSLEAFDFAEQGMVTGRRDTTTVATQALYLLNDPFIARQSSALAVRLNASDNGDTPALIEQAYLLVFGRSATPMDIERGTAYLAQYDEVIAEVKSSSSAPLQTAWESFCHALLASAEFRYIR